MEILNLVILVVVISDLVMWILGSSIPLSKMEELCILDLTEAFQRHDKVKTTADNSDPSIIGDKDWGRVGNPGFLFAYTGSDWRLNAGDGTNRIDISGGVINDDEWHMLVATFDRDGIASLYQDGALVGTADISFFGSMESGYPINIAQEGTGSYGQWFQGSVANAMIFDYVLTAAEVTNLLGG